MCTPLVQRTLPLVTAMSPTSRQPLASRDASPSDDDIEYLHTNPAPNASLSSPVDLAPIGHQRQVNGIKLHVEANTSSLELDEYTPKVLSFHKADAGVVHIGRRSGTEVTSEKAATESDSKSQAMFRCAVVSRVHAKIVFADSGHVYVVDLSSHHGTHLRKAGEGSTKTVKPETPTTLSDGDTLILGKSVGRGQDTVRPVVMKVELMYEPRKTLELASFKSLFGPIATSNSSRRLGRSISTSGSYGLRGSPSPSPAPPVVSTDSITVTTPPAAKASLPPFSSIGLSLPSADVNLSNHIGRAFEAFKRFLPPAVAPHEPLPLPPRQEILGASGSDGPSYEENDSGSDFSSSEDNTSDIEFIRSSQASPDRQEDEARSPQNESDSDEAEEDKSESCPMDLATPSSALFGAEDQVYSPIPRWPPSPEVPMVGAWPLPVDMDLYNPFASSLPPLFPQASCASPAISASSDMALESDTDAEPVNQSADTADEQPENRVNLDCVVSNPPPVNQIPSVSAQATPHVQITEAQNVPAKDVENLKEVVNVLKEEVAGLFLFRAETRARLKSNYEQNAERLYQLEDNVKRLKTQYCWLSEQYDNMSLDLPVLHKQVEHMEVQVSAVEAAQSEKDKATSDISSDEVHSLKDVVCDLKALRDSICKDMEERAFAARLAHEQAISDFARWEADIQAKVKEYQETLKHSSLTPSKKRKRDDDDSEHPVIDHDQSRADDMAVDENWCGNCEAGSSQIRADAGESDGTTMPPPKRPRHLLATAVQTATAVTLGAVATWSALAYI